MIVSAKSAKYLIKSRASSFNLFERKKEFIEIIKVPFLQNTKGSYLQVGQCPFFSTTASIKTFSI